MHLASRQPYPTPTARRGPPGRVGSGVLRESGNAPGQERQPLPPRADCTTVDGPGAAVGGWGDFEPDRRRPMPRAYSSDLRERALAAYEGGEGRPAHGVW